MKYIETIAEGLAQRRTTIRKNNTMTKTQIAKEKRSLVAGAKHLIKYTQARLVIINARLFDIDAGELNAQNNLAYYQRQKAILENDIEEYEFCIKRNTAKTTN